MVQIDSLEKYISIIKGFYALEGCAGVQKIFYRGQSNCNYKLIPSLTHILEGCTDDYESYIAFEKEIIERTKLKYPDMFGDNNSIDELALLQHYGLPTRLMDIRIKEYRPGQRDFVKMGKNLISIKENGGGWQPHEKF